MLPGMKNNGSSAETKSAQIADAAAVVAKRLASPEAQAQLASSAAASRARARAILQGAIIDPKFLAKRITF